MGCICLPKTTWLTFPSAAEACKCLGPSWFQLFLQPHRGPELIAGFLAPH